MQIGIIILLAFGLSMDAFSLSLIYGTLKLDKHTHIILSIIVGIFHFFMPIFGFLVGKIILSIIHINPKIIAGIIFIILGIEMFLSIYKKENIKVLTTIPTILIFAFTVSIDSFSTGIGINAISNNIISCSFIFSIVSTIITYLGLILGKKLNQIIGYTSNIIGALILISLGIFYVK